MIQLNLTLERVCKKCTKKKDVNAFMRSRAVCRLCWPYLSPEEKRDNMAYVGYSQMAKARRSLTPTVSQ